MSRSHDSKYVRPFLTASLAVVLGACGGSVQSDQEDTAAPSAEAPFGELTNALGSSAAPEGGCDPRATASAGWVNTFIPDSTGVFTAEFRVHPSSASDRPPLLDAVIGLSNGPAASFRDLGPIVRFAPNGNIDARNGDGYAGAFPYVVHDAPYGFQLRIDVATRRYSAWVRHLDSPYKPWELLAENFAFRAEQSNVPRLSNIARFVDSAQGSVVTCAFAYASPTACTQSGARVWSSRAFPARTGLVRLEFYAWVNSASIDAVIGASNGVPTAFKSLAAAVRFRPDGKVDVRNGAGYAADAPFSYSAGSYYRFAMDIDLPRGRYSASVTALSASWSEQTTVSLAHDYAFRSEQAGVRALDHLGQYVDGTSGFVNACALTIVY